MLQDDPGRFRRYFGMVLCIVSAITMPLSLFVAVFAPALTHVLLGDQWLPCAPIIAVLALGTFIRQTSGSTALILLAGGRSQTHLALIFSSNLLLIALLFAGAHWGALGVAAAEVAATFLFLFPRLHFTLRGSPVSFPDFFAAIARPALASLAMAAVLWGLSATFPLPSDTLRIGVGAALAPVLFLGTWSLLPGGRLELTGLFNSVREGFLRKAAASA
jgi:PST family polysaccharide transporter